MTEAIIQYTRLEDPSVKKAVSSVVRAKRQWRATLPAEHAALPRIVVSERRAAVSMFEELAKLSVERRRRSAMLVVCEGGRQLDLEVLERAASLDVLLRVVRHSREAQEARLMETFREAIHDLLAKMSPDRIRRASFEGRLRVEYGDGFVQLIDWDSLPFSNRSPQLLPETARPNARYGAVSMDDVDGDEFEIDALWLRQRSDQGLRRELEDVAGKERARVGNKIRQVRTLKKQTQPELAAASGVPQTSISKIERGEREPRFSTLTKLARALDVDVGELLPTDDA